MAVWASSASHLRCPIARHVALINWLNFILRSIVLHLWPWIKHMQTFEEPLPYSLQRVSAVTPTGALKHSQFAIHCCFHCNQIKKKKKNSTWIKQEREWLETIHFAIKKPGFRESMRISWGWNEIHEDYMVHGLVDFAFHFCSCHSWSLPPLLASAAILRLYFTFSVKI